MTVPCFTRFGFALAVLVGLTTGTASAGLNQWTSGGPPDGSVLALAVNPHTPGVVYAGSNGGGVFRSLDGGASWSPASSGLTALTVAALAVNPIDAAVVYAGTSGGGVFRSVLGGNGWTPVNTGLTNDLITTIAIHPVVPTTLYVGTTGGGVFKSVNGGNSWTAMNSGLVNPLVTALAINPAAPNVVYAGTSGGGVFRSVDEGNGWTAVNTGLVNPVISALAINPQAPSMVFAGTVGGGVFRSLDAGATWAAVNDGLTNTVVAALAINPRIPTSLHVGTVGGGVFRSVTAGAGWAPLNTGLTNSVISALAITPGGVCVHAATRGSGVFDFAFEPGACAARPAAASVLPSSRSVMVGASATAFASIINPTGVTGRDCRIALISPVPGTFSFQTTDPATNQVVGTADTPVDIPPGGLQSYVLGLTPSRAFAAVDVRFDFGCANIGAAPVIAGVNTLLLSGSNAPVPDIVALAAADGGIVNVPGTTATGAFAVATVNTGAGASITASADTGGVPLPVTLGICETAPATGQCLAGQGGSVTRVINPGETPTFAIFVTGSGTVPFNPAVNRVFVRFTDPGGATRGSTSVAVRTQ